VGKVVLWTEREDGGKGRRWGTTKWRLNHPPLGRKQKLLIEVGNGREWGKNMLKGRVKEGAQGGFGRNLKNKERD